MTETCTPETVPAHDRAVLADLARRYRDALADNPPRIAAWTEHNMLGGSGRPLQLIFPEGGWTEIAAELELQCASDTARRLESDLRKELYEHEHFHHDKVLMPQIDVNHGIHVGGWGLEAEWTHSHQERGSRTFKPVIDSMRDVERITAPTVHFQPEIGEARAAWLRDLVGDHIPVALIGIKKVDFHLMMQYTAWRGLEETLMDFHCEPDLVHEAMRRLVAGHEAVLDRYRELGVLEGNPDNTYHSSGGNGWCSDLPAGRPVRTQDMWAAAESQEMAGVGPAQHAEFCVPYESRLLAHFGRNGYGCCEPLHDRLETVLAMPNMRRISISPWADVDLSARVLAGRRAIFSWKPNPARLCGTFQEEHIRAEIAHTVAVCAEHDCQLEIILKDTHSCDRQPWRFIRWSEICREEIDRVWGPAIPR